MKGLKLQDVRLELAVEESSSAIALNAHMTASEFLVAALDLEEQQYVALPFSERRKPNLQNRCHLTHFIKSLGSHPTPKQSADAVSL